MNIVKHLKRKSIFLRILIPVLIILVCQTVIIFGMFFLGGTFDTLNQNALDILNEQSKSRRDIIQTEMNNRWSKSLYDSVESVNSVTAQVLSAYAGADLSDMMQTVNAYEGNYSLADVILRAQCDNVVRFILQSSVRSWFIVLDDGGVNKGLYIRSDSIDSIKVSDIKSHVAPWLSMVYLKDEKSVSTSNVMGSFTINQDSPNSQFFYKPLQLAKSEMLKPNPSKNHIDYAYWCPAFNMNDKADDRQITCSVPLIYNNRVYGVMGVGISVNDLYMMLPCQEIGNNGVYFLGNDTNNDLNFTKTIHNGPEFIRLYGDANTLSAKADKKYDNGYKFSKSDYFDDAVYGSVQYLEIYNNKNSPFAEETWALSAFMRKGELFSFSNNLRTTFIITAIISVVIGLVFIVIICFAITLPVLRLTEKVKTAKPDEKLSLGRTKIYEIDQFVFEIEKLSNNIKNLERLEKDKIEYERDHDVLTHLINRRAFLVLLSNLAANPDRAKTCALIMIDLDNLKFVNDTYGHDIGDAYLKKAAETLGSFSAPGVAVSRMAGDEFIVLIYGHSKRSGIYNVINQIKEEIKFCNLKLPDGKEMRVRFSAGIAWYPDDTNDFDQLIKYADFAMYNVKKTVKGEFREFNIDIYNKDIYLLRAKEDLNRLIEEKLLDYHFQPIISAKTGEVFGYETLMRSKLTSLNNTQEILNLASNEAKLYKIEELSWFKSLECYSRHVMPGSDKLLFINTLPNQFLSDTKLKIVEGLYRDYLKNIVIEITKDEKMDEIFMNMKREAAGSWGAKIALDGLGKGYNSDAILLSVMPDYIKIDMEIIRNVDTDESRRKLLDNYISYAKRYGIGTIAEGVETYGEMETLIKSGVDYLQGYYLVHPSEAPAPVPQDIKMLILKINETIDKSVPTDESKK